MLKHVARIPIVVNLKSGRFIRVPAQPLTSCVTVGKSFPSFLCCERSWAQSQLCLRTQHSATSCLATCAQPDNRIGSSSRNELLGIVARTAWCWLFSPDRKLSCVEMQSGDN